MCDPFTIAAIATGVGSTAAGAVGSSKNKKANAYAQNQQTNLSKEQFDARTKLANEIFAENLGLSSSVFDELASLSDQEFQQRNGLSKQTFQDLLATEDAQMLRDSSAASANTNAIRDARLGRDATRDTAAQRYSEILAGANQRQAGFRAEGDSIASDLVAAFTPGAFEGRRADATAARDALAATAASPSSPTASLPMSGAGKAAYSRYAGKGLADAAAENTAKSRVASYGDAVDAGGRTIDRGNERTAFVTDAARRALAPLGAELGAQSLTYNNAADTYAGRTRAADADLDAALGLSATEAQGKGRAISRYGADMDAALAAFFGGKIGSTGSRGDALIGANDTRLAGTNSASMNLENGMQGITQFRMANSGPGIWGTLSQFGSALTPTLFQAGAQGSGFKKPAQTAP